MTYPRIGAVKPLLSGARCALCFKGARHAVTLEFNHIRREDLVVGLCEQHKLWGEQNAMALIDRIHANTTSEDCEGPCLHEQISLLDDAKDGSCDVAE